MSPVLLLAAACATALQGGVLDPADGSVLSGPEARATLNQCSRYGPREATAFWNPSAQQIDELEKRLPSFLRRQKFAPPGDARGYFRQYVGVVLGDRKFVYVNGFPKDAIAEDVAAFQQFTHDHPDVRITATDFPESMRSRAGWRSYAVVVCDGGSSYWGVLYDPETQQFSEYSANGVG